MGCFSCGLPRENPIHNGHAYDDGDERRASLTSATAGESPKECDNWHTGPHVSLDNHATPGEPNADIPESKRTATAAWISVKDRLPEDGASVIVFSPEWDDLYLRYRVAWIDYDDTPPTWVHSGEAVENVTHWRPLPDPPNTVRAESPSTAAKEKL